MGTSGKNANQSPHCKNMSNHSLESSHTNVKNLIELKLFSGSRSLIHFSNDRNSTQQCEKVLPISSLITKVFSLPEPNCCHIFLPRKIGKKQLSKTFKNTQ